MLAKTIEFVDFNGVPRKTTLYFNLTKTEIVDWSADSPEGIQSDMQDAIDNRDQRKLLDFVKDLVFRSYGIRDKDGIHFDKSPEISRRFENSAMYDPLLLELFADEGGATTAFITGLMPADLVAAAMKEGKIPNPEDRETIEKEYEPSARDRFAQTTESATEDISVVPFAVEETPLDEGAAAEVTRRKAREQAEFEEWKRSREDI